MVVVALAEIMEMVVPHFWQEQTIPARNWISWGSCDKRPSTTHMRTPDYAPEMVTDSQIKIAL